MPDPDWACEWALDYGARMATKAAPAQIEELQHPQRGREVNRETDAVDPPSLRTVVGALGHRPQVDRDREAARREDLGWLHLEVADQFLDGGLSLVSSIERSTPPRRPSTGV